MKVLPVLIVFLMTTLVFAAAKPKEEWRAPADAAKVANKVPASKESVAKGRRLYLRSCMTCHGISGKGDGPEAAGLDPAPTDFTNADKMKGETDGELFWKIGTGKGKMKPYSALVPKGTDEDRWNIVNFIRTLAPKEKDNSKPAEKGNEAQPGDKDSSSPADKDKEAKPEK